MKWVALALSVCALASCATPPGSQTDVAQYGTPPSDQDLYQYMSHLRDSLPPTRYVTFRDDGYQHAVKKLTFTDQDGKTVAAWEYDFVIAVYDDVDAQPAPRQRRYRAIFFNGRPIGMLAPDNTFVRGGLPDPTVPRAGEEAPVSASTPAPAQGR